MVIVEIGLDCPTETRISKTVISILAYLSNLLNMMFSSLYVKKCNSAINTAFLIEVLYDSLI